MNAKILSLEEIAERLRHVRAAGERIVLCHGCFDLMHIGHIKHLQEAKTMGDVLVVSVTPDRHVAKGPNRPAFPDGLRAEALAALACVDFVAVNREPTGVDAIRLLRPNAYVKGPACADPRNRSAKLWAEIAASEEVGAEVRFTRQPVFSSTVLLGRYFAGPAFP